MGQPADAIEAINRCFMVTSSPRVRRCREPSRPTLRHIDRLRPAAIKISVDEGAPGGNEATTQPSARAGAEVAQPTTS